MSRFVQGADRRQPTLLPECLDDYVAEDNPVRVVDVFVDELDLKGLGFEGMTPAATGRPAVDGWWRADPEGSPSDSTPENYCKAAILGSVG